MQSTEVISLFLDNEPFDAHDSAAVLSEAGGRDTLIQLIGLRHVVQPTVESVLVPMPARRRARFVWLSAAAVVLAMGAGYALGTSRHGGGNQPSLADRSTPPAPTIVVPRASGAQWEPIRKGA